MRKIKLQQEVVVSYLNICQTKGQFFPGQMSARLFMPTENVEQNYQTAFHERFHYLQCVFTPYGHLKWGTNRSFTADILNLWLSQADNVKKKIPVAEYLENDENSIRLLFEIMLKDFAKRWTEITDGVLVETEELKLLGLETVQPLNPEIQVDGNNYTLHGMDIIESFAKFEEALLALYIDGKELNDTINPDILPQRYYLALYYFVDQVGMDRLSEFPIVCELALCFSHIPKFDDRSSYSDNHPAWRFVKIVDFLKCNHLEYDIFDDKSFFEYTSTILRGCKFEDWDELWSPAEKYAKECDLTMGKEMLLAIEYKKAHPWSLTYPMADPKIFFGKEFNSFQPLFVITDHEVFYNVARVNQAELLLENELQSFVSQIVGEKSQYNMYPNSIQCADNYYGIKSCKYWLDGSCDGHLFSDSKVPKTVMDENNNILDGCMLEICLNIWGTSIKDIQIGKTGRKLSFKEIASKLKEMR